MSKQKIIKAAAAICLCLMSTLAATPLPAAAQTSGSSGFSVRAVIPENQIDKGKSYFDLLMVPGQSQTLAVEVVNYGSEEITVDVAVRAASTNRNGLIEYQVKTAPDETLKHPFDTVADTVGEVKIAPGSTQTVNITVTMPAQQFDGVILGGVVFTRRGDNAAAEGVSINNQFSYVIGVKLTETDKVIPPDFRIKSIEPVLINYRRAVSVNIHNPVALIVKGANVTANIYKKTDAAPLLSVNETGIDMAPNSVYPLPVEWGSLEMEPGEYRAEIKLTYDGTIWEWDQAFSIDADKAQEINKDSLDKPSKQNWWAAWWWIPALAVIVILLLWIAFLLGRRRRDDDETKKKG